MHVLLIKTSSLGDVIHNLPVATDIARAFPGARIDWCVEEGFAAIPRLHPAVGQVIPVAIRRWRRALGQAATWREIALFRRRLRAVSYDAVIDTQSLIKSALLAHFARGHRFGYDKVSAREPLASHAYATRIAVSRQLPAVRRNRELAAAALGYALAEAPIDYGLAVPPLAADWLPAGPYAVCLSATSRDDKCWPEQDWIKLIAALAARGLAAVLPAGSSAERARAHRLATQSGIVAPGLTLPDLAGLLAGAEVTVGVDTGLTHLSVAVGTPTIALYVASDPGLTGAVGRGFCCNLGRRDQPPAGAEVVAALDQALAAPG